VPDTEHLTDRTYPLARPVLVVFADKPTGPRRRMLDFLLGESGQQLMFKSGLVPVK
jgi:phosphate transport system substrate-binding protein